MPNLVSTFNPTLPLLVIFAPRKHWCKCYGSEGKGIPNTCSDSLSGKKNVSAGKGFLAVGSQGISQSHTAQQISHKSFIGKDTKGRQALYRGSWRELSRMNGIGGFCDLILGFFSIGWGLATLLPQEAGKSRQSCSLLVCRLGYRWDWPVTPPGACKHHH